MKILITVNTYYPYKDGVSMVTRYQAEGLVKKGHEVTVLTSAYEGSPEQETVNGVKIIRDDIKTVHAIHRGNKKEYQEKMIALSKEMDVLVNVCTQTARTDWLLPVLDKISCPKFLYLHGIIDFSWNKEHRRTINSFLSKLWNNLRWKYLYVKQASNLRKYDMVSQLHEFDTGNWYFEKKYGIQSVILENAADDIFFEKYGAAKKEEPCMLCVANYIERKNQMLCLEAFYQADIPSEWNLVFIGSEETEYYQMLRKRKEELEQKYQSNRKVSFEVNVPREEIPDRVAKAELYLLGSSWEAFPISIVEAMAAGVPFIATGVGCIRYLPGGVSVNNEKEMAYWMEKLSFDKRVREYLGQAGHEYAVNHFQIADKVNKLEKYLLEIYNQKSRV